MAKEKKTQKEGVKKKMPSQQQTLNEMARHIREAGKINIYQLSLKMQKNWKTLQLGYVPLFEYGDKYLDIHWNKDEKTFYTDKYLKSKEGAKA